MPSVPPHWLLSTCLLTLLPLLGCGEGVESDLRTILQQTDQAVAFDCDCFYTEDGYASPAECKMDLLLSADDQDCFVDAVRPVAETNPAYYDCLKDVGSQILACAQRVGCDEVGINDCFEMNDLCPDNPCAGLRDAEFEECQIEAARAQAALDVCFPPPPVE